MLTFYEKAPGREVEEALGRYSWLKEDGVEIKLTAKHIKITDAIRDYVHEKMEKAQKYFDHIVWGQAFIFIEKRSHKCEMLIHTPGQMFRVLAEASDLYSAVDLASDKMDAQLKKFKERMRFKGRHGKQTVRREVETDSAVPELQFSVVRQPVSPITPHQAVQEMEAKGQEFRVYQDRETNQIQLVFRRSDESYGILLPVKKNAR
ncbi:MAG: ribosome-associated translation inhibitor RaiA [Elusimicrobia bacterium]|nr:ribosome-associated translation inhibitor RaiA [Elusimicrobiota bacterium]